MQWLHLLRTPDAVVLQTDHAAMPANLAGDRATCPAGELTFDVSNDQVTIRLAAPTAGIRTVQCRWRMDVPETLRVLGDHWERGYGDLEWRGLSPQRILPWYALLHDADRTGGIGVATGAGAMCFWRIDSRGVTLYADVANGARGVQLAGRVLEVAAVRQRRGQAGESPFAAAGAFCRSLCDDPRMPAGPVYGGNDWYYAYGENSAEQIRQDARRIADWAAGLENRPFMVIDAGWQAEVGHDDKPCNCGGPWTAGNARFPDLAGLAAEMRETGTRPGIWVRPLAAGPDDAGDWLLPVERATDDSATIPVLDPSHPGVLERIESDFACVAGWGFELIKHDWSCCDTFGRWGFQMGPELTNAGWGFHDPSRTSAEILREAYAAMRRGAGEALVLGCNAVGHLGAGLFDLQRTGDDTSGRNWERTARMGPNTLAFRMGQHGAFFAVDGDCVGLTSAVPWALNRQWLDLLARSGTPLFVSADPRAVGAEQEQALRRAFEIASRPRDVGEPLDWLHTTRPARWRFADGETTYDWTEPAGVPRQMGM